MVGKDEVSSKLREKKFMNVKPRARHLSIADTNGNNGVDKTAKEDKPMRKPSNKSEGKSQLKNSQKTRNNNKPKNLRSVSVSANLYQSTAKDRISVSSESSQVTKTAPSNKVGKLKRESFTIREEKSELPDGVINIDVEDGLYEYAGEVIVYLRERELDYVLAANFLEGGATTSTMRAMLVDWLIQVASYQNLCQETLYLCITMVDTVLSKRDIKHERLQLVGITCLLIASKLEEYYPADISKLIHLTKDSYTFKQVIRMEIVILEILEYQLYFPEMMSFLRRFTRAAFRNHDRKFVETCQYMVDSIIINKGFSTIRPSEQAAASVFATTLLCCIDADQIPCEDSLWTKTLQYYTQYKFEDISPTAHSMIRAMLNASETESSFTAARDKYKSLSKHQRLAQENHVSVQVLTQADVWLKSVIKS